tara:strand:+ start:968 stop:1606 length:639 start_codon:yes stop_codon:yes gene_type:complete
MTFNNTKFIILGSSFFFSILLIVFLISKQGSGTNNLSTCNLNSNASTFADFRGNFSLIDEYGQEISNDSIFDKPTLLYFGYTFCPDICPFDLMRNAEAVELLQIENYEVKPVFISLDPKRDTPSVLRDFTAFHHPNMLGLTGSEDQLEVVKNVYKIYSEIPRNSGNDYILNHSTFSYFVLPKDGVQTYFTRKENPQDLAATMKCILDIQLNN